MELQEFKTLLDQQGAAFTAFKEMVDGELKKKANADDPVVTEKLTKIETALDKAVEGKAALESKIAAEVKAREDLELKLGRMNLSGHSEESAKREVEIKSFNDDLAGLNAGRNKPFTPLDAKGYDDYKAALVHYMREGKENLSPDEVKTLQVGSDPDGGYWVTPDKTGRMVKKVYETSLVRQNASVQAITTDALEGVEDLGEAGAGYAGELAQGSDSTTPQIGKWRIPVFWIDTEPKATQQLLDDAAVDVEGWLSDKVANKFGRFENAEFVTGAANKIKGFMLGYTQTSDSGSGVTWGEVGFVSTGTARTSRPPIPATRSTTSSGR
jgi:HK97 family phage major capsid protein